MAKNSWNREVQAKVIAKAWKDEGFRKQLLSNPKATLKEFGVEVPANVEMTFLQEDTSHFYFILPPAPAKMRNLSEADLEKLAAARDTTTGLVG